MMWPFQGHPAGGVEPGFSPGLSDPKGCAFSRHCPCLSHVGSAHHLFHGGLRSPPRKVQKDPAIHLHPTPLPQTMPSPLAPSPGLALRQDTRSWPGSGGKKGPWIDADNGVGAVMGVKGGVRGGKAAAVKDRVPGRQQLCTGLELRGNVLGRRHSPFGVTSAGEVGGEEATVAGGVGGAGP